jgi:hypothetical protein
MFIAILSGCSVYKALSQPEPADLTGLGVGSSRDDIMSKIGAPKFTDFDENGNKKDVFEFLSGANKLSKLRALPYLAGDVFFAGLTEIIFWPMELTLLEAAQCQAVVSYDKSQVATSWILTTKKDSLKGC